MEKYRYKNVEPVCVLNFASEAFKSSNSVGVDCNGCSSAHSVAHLTKLQALSGSSPRTRTAVSTGEGRRACARV